MYTYICILMCSFIQNNVNIEKFKQLISNCGDLLCFRCKAGAQLHVLFLVQDHKYITHLVAITNDIMVTHQIYQDKIIVPPNCKLPKITVLVDMRAKSLSIHQIQ